jgi:Ca-activated chloride channel family protein
LAFIDLRFYAPNTENLKIAPEENLSTEGIAIYLVLDQSGSMTEKITTYVPGRGLESISKIDLVKYVTSLFIKGDAALNLPGRPNDLIGLVEFARTPQIVVPLTLDRKELLDKLAEFKPVTDPSEDGTAIGYAILKTARLIEATRNYARDLLGQGKPAYEIQNSIIILVTDGLQDPNPADKGSKWRQIDPREVAADLKEKGIRVYIVNVEPKFATETFAANRRQLQQAAELTGGQFYMVNSRGENLNSIYASIDAIEKSQLPLEETLAEKLKQTLAKEQLPGLYHTYYTAPYFIAFALSCLFISLILESTWLRKVP